MTNNTKPRKITNRQISEFVESRRPFEANSASGQWENYMPSTGRMDEAWATELRALFASDGEPVFVVKSYYTPVAWWSEASGWVVPDTKFSATTSKAQGLIRYGIGSGQFRSTLSA